MTTKEFKMQYALGSMSQAMRREMAENSTSKEILEILSKDKSAGVRYWVVLNSNVTKDILKNLSKDKEYHVREEVKRYLRE